MNVADVMSVVKLVIDQTCGVNLLTFTDGIQGGDSRVGLSERPTG